MRLRPSRLILPAALAAAIPTFVLAQQAQPPAPSSQAPAKSARAERGPRLSPEAMQRLQDGRMAMIKETLKLNDAQLKLWAPVEANLRASAVERRQVREERRQSRRDGAQAPSLPDRLDRAAAAMTKRGEQMKAFADVFKPFYAALGDEQKALAGVVLREARGGLRDHGRRWAGREGGPQPR